MKLSRLITALSLIGAACATPAFAGDTVRISVVLDQSVQWDVLDPPAPKLEVQYTDIHGAKVYDAADQAGAGTTAATAAIGNIDKALKAANEQRANIGAGINRLTYAADNLSNISMNTAASRSRIEDTDYAQASTELARTQIIQQAATAMLAQANQSPQSVLALLK